MEPAIGQAYTAPLGYASLDAHRQYRALKYRQDPSYSHVPNAAGKNRRSLGAVFQNQLHTAQPEFLVRRSGVHECVKQADGLCHSTLACSIEGRFCAAAGLECPKKIAFSILTLAGLKKAGQSLGTFRIGNRVEIAFQLFTRQFDSGGTGGPASVAATHSEFSCEAAAARHRGL